MHIKLSQTHVIMSIFFIMDADPYNIRIYTLFWHISAILTEI